MGRGASGLGRVHPQRLLVSAGPSTAVRGLDDPGVLRAAAEGNGYVGGEGDAGLSATSRDTTASVRSHGVWLLNRWRAEKSRQVEFPVRCF